MVDRIVRRRFAFGICTDGFENRRAEDSESVSEVALRVSGQFARKAGAGPGEYHVVVVIRDMAGAELARKVIGVGGLAPGEERKVDLSVEIFDPPVT